MTLIELHTPSGKPFYINPDKIVHIESSTDDTKIVLEGYPSAVILSLSLDAFLNKLAGSRVTIFR